MRITGGRPHERLRLCHPGRQLEIAVHLGNHVELGTAGPERGVQLGHVAQEALVLRQRDGFVRDRDQPRRDIVHEQDAARGPGTSVARAGTALLRGGAHDRLVEAARQPGQDAPLPQLQRDAPQRAGRSRGPVHAQVEMLEHVAPAADDDPLQPGPGLARSPVQGRPLGHPREQLGHVAVAPRRGRGHVAVAPRPGRARAAMAPRRGRGRVTVALRCGTGPRIRHRPLPSRPAAPLASGRRRTRCRRRSARRAP